MKITQIIQGVYNPSAGPSYSVSKLADQLFEAGEDSSVLTLGKPPAEWPYEASLDIHDGWLERTTGVSLSMTRKARAIARLPGIIHSHGIWRASNLFPLVAPRNSKARIVCSPRGMLSRWSMNYKSHIKQPLWHLLQKPALDRCDCYHATAAQEYDDIRRAGLSGPVAIIPNGVYIPKLSNDLAKKKQLVFLSRIDPKKGLDMLLPAWTNLAETYPDWELYIAGPLTTEYAHEIRDLSRTLRAPRVHFTGEVLGNHKSQLLSESAVFVLPTYSENFGIAVAEALAHGTPVITTTETPWREVTDTHSGWCIEPDQTQLESVLREAMDTPLFRLNEMGQNGRKWMEASFGWERIASMMLATYNWLLTGSDKPTWIEN